MFKLSKKSMQRMGGVDNQLIRIAELAIQITVIDFGIPKDGGVRTEIRQQQLFHDGKSRADGIHDKSNHQTGQALDFYAYVDGKASWREDHLAMVACSFLQAASILGISLNWGGLWSSAKKTNGIPYGWDMAHVELG